MNVSAQKRSRTPMSEPLVPRLLLAEDEPVQRLLLERQLCKAGYVVDTAQNGAEALAKILKETYQILITDWDMPGMDGATLCRRVRDAKLPGYLYILLLTGHESTADIVAGLEAGADDYIRKPANDAELLARLKAGRRVVELTRQIQLLSVTDPLVGTYNRRYLTDELALEIERARRYGRPLAAVIADLDGFKRINDEHGHQTGDEVLRCFAEGVWASIRQNDWIARYGGEEFVIVLPETNLVDAAAAAEKIRLQCATTPMVTSSGDLMVTASFGVAALDCTSAAEPETVTTLLRRADVALYRSKNAGRNRVTAAIGSPSEPDPAKR
jgi:two-component system, cell cycle response regulator